ncbi:hypothetical protein DOTSEDRAFT_71201 [Dothistroma septosporum NZE10]|uniref:Uncharacterized protein n=1 Tax=Dothistroma septosporum (strain NZE10 / CBS 128990) TaxID=675120 RepID=N1PPP0_DOTSN|nr:hypothetical protein DOTSEDRAFT_71201 [Dothistroma septosporum NZE10]
MNGSTTNFECGMTLTLFGVQFMAHTLLEMRNTLGKQLDQLFKKASSVHTTLPTCQSPRTFARASQVATILVLGDTVFALTEVDPGVRLPWAQV